MGYIKSYSGIPLLVASSILTILSGCTPPPSAIAPENEQMSFEQRKLELKDLKSWQLKGGIAVKDGRDGFSASMNWAQYSPHAFKINLIGPLGNGNIKLIKKGKLVTLTDGKKTFNSDNPETLLRKHTGYYIPVRSLYYWIRGLPDPRLPSQKSTDQYGHVSNLKQQGWQINYTRFTAFRGLDVPSKIIMSKAGIRVKIIINQWRQ